MEKIKFQDCFPKWLKLSYPHQWCGRVPVDPRFPHTGFDLSFNFSCLQANGNKLVPCGAVLFSHYIMSTSFLNPGVLLGSQIPYHCTTREACLVVYRYYILY